jgi:plastocyanin
MKRIFAITATLLLVAWTPGTDSVSHDTDDSEPRVITIRMIDKGSATWRFEPAQVQVRQGDVVRFVQDDVAPHNVQFKDMPASAQLAPTVVMGPFLIQKGATYEIEVDERFAPGLYKYACTPHAPLGMTAELEVLETDPTS